MIISDKDCFHVHTYRCGHAEDVPDEAYIKAAISIGAKGIWFTDHAPFPGNPFKNRMKYSELDEYLSSLLYLKENYNGQIQVHIGLEIEYFPLFDQNGYYKQLCSDSRIELLLLGQHMAETSPEHYTFEWNKEQLNNEEYLALGKAQIAGIQSGYFNAVAHPDRIFRRQKTWSGEMSAMAEQIINAAIQTTIPLEINEASKHQKHHYWQEFWELSKEAMCINGLDAHSISEIKLL